MALDHALMARARRTGEAVLRVYGWTTPVLSLGRNQRALDVYDLDAVARFGVDVVRRPTGGRALLHHREITYSVTAPADDAHALLAMYARINRLLLNALSAMGVPVALAEPSTRTPVPGGLPCFAEPTAGEIVAGGRKLAGSAQWRDAGALLQHGSVLVDDDQAMIPLLMREPPPAAPAPATLRELLGRAPDLDELAHAMFVAVRDAEDSTAELLGDEDELADECVAIVPRYRDAEWTWRR